MSEQRKMLKNPILKLPYKVRWFLMLVTSAIVFSCLFGFMGFAMDLSLTLIKPFSYEFTYLLILMGFIYGIVTMLIQYDSQKIAKIVMREQSYE